MIIECWTILVIVPAIGLIIRRTGRKNYFLNVLPLTFIPAAHLMVYYAHKAHVPLFQGDLSTLQAGGDILTLLVACLCFGFFAHNFKTRRVRLLYLAVCGIFSFTLTLLFMFGNG